MTRPMPNSVSASRKAFTALSATGLNTIANSPQAPVKSRCQSAWPGSAFERGMQHARDLRPLRKPARDLQARGLMLREPHAHACAGRAARDTCRPGRRTGPCVNAVSLSRGQAAAFADDRARASRRNGRRYIWCRPGSRDRRPCRRRGSKAASPRYCPSAPARRAHARRPRSPECPASRTTASPATPR